MFFTLAVDVYEGVPAITSSDLEIARDELCGFRDARAGVVEEQEEGVFDPALGVGRSGTSSSFSSRSC